MTVILTGRYVGTKKGVAGFSFWNGDRKDVSVNRTEKCNPRLRKGVLYDVAVGLKRNGTMEMEEVRVHG